MRFKLFLLPLFGVCCAYGNRIEIVSNRVCPPLQIQEILQEKGLPLVVEECNFKIYPNLKRERTPLGRILKKLSLVSTYPAPVKKDVSKFLFMNIPELANRDLDLYKLPKEKMVLFMWEPPLRLHTMYYKKIHDCFSKIYTWDDDLVDNIKYFKFYYPVLHPMISHRPSFKEKRFCTMVIGATTPFADHPEALYGERVKMIRFFEEVGEKEFEFYGTNWNPAEYKTYRGPIDNKIEVMKCYKFTICYENTQGLNGYVTEKIFDCFEAGTVPIYWGAANIEKYVPKTCFIDRRDFKTEGELYTFLKRLTEKEYETYLMHIRTYLNSQEAQLFSFEHYKTILYEALK